MVSDSSLTMVVHSILHAVLSLLLSLSADVSSELLIARWVGGREGTRSARGVARMRSRQSSSSGRALGQHKESLKETHQGLPAHALLALTPSHRTSPANKYKPKKDSFIRSRLLKPGPFGPRRSLVLLLTQLLS